MVKKIADDKNTAIIIFVAVVCINIISILKFGDNIGLYLDAVNPDYLATKLVNPNSLTGSWTLPYIGIPLLGQAYHGTLTMIGSYFSILITGTTSVMQLRVVNSVYSALAVVIIYKIFDRLNVKKKLSVAICLLITLSPNVIGTYFTQYYIELPGVALFLAMCYGLIKWKNDNENLLLLLRCGLYGGLAFYDYFNFLFFLPGAMLIVIFVSILSNKKRTFENSVVFIVGYAYGTLPYILGYSGMLLCQISSINELQRRLAQGGITILVIGMLYVIYTLQKYIDKRRRVVSVLMLCAGALGGLLLGVFVLKKYDWYFQGLNVSGTEGGLYTRIKLIVEYLKQVLLHSSLEYLVIRENFGHGLVIVPLLTVVTSITAVWIYRINGARVDKNKIYVIIAFYMSVCCYLLCCVILATRMQGQHFVPMMFIMYIILGLSIAVIFEYFNSNQYVNICLGLGLVLILTIFMTRESQIEARAKSIARIDTNFNQLYSNAIEKMAEEALQNKERGEKEYYIFPQWGMLCGFDYLTQNSVCFTDTIDLDQLRWLRDDLDYEIVVCYWDEDNSSVYENLLYQVFPEGGFNKKIVNGNYGEIYEICVE